MTLAVASLQTELNSSVSSIRTDVTSAAVASTAVSACRLLADVTPAVALSET